MLRYLFMPGFLFLTLLSLGQIESSQVLTASAGSGQVISGEKFNWTFGEPIIGTVGIQTFVFQGFQQLYSSPTPIFNNLPPEIEIVVFPNPFVASALLQIRAPYELDMRIRLWDFYGQLLHTYKSEGTELAFTIDLTGMPSGVYLLEMADVNTGNFRTIPLIKQN